MALSHSPKIVTDGLVFMYDTYDGKSFKGEPTTNYGPASFGDWGTESTAERIATGNTFNGQPTYNCRTVVGQSYRGIEKTISGLRTAAGSSGTVTMSCMVRNNNATAYSMYAYIGHDFSSGISVTANSDWQKVQWTVNQSSMNNDYVEFRPYTNNASIYLEMTMPMVEVNKGHATQFVNGTRSATQGLIDRTGTSTIDISNASFDSNAQMTFDGTDDYISIPTYTFGNGSWTLNMWVNVSAFANYNLMSNSSGGPVANVFGAHGSNPKIFYMNYDGAWKDHYGNLTLTTNNWYFLTWVNYEGASASAGTMKMYVNGVADSDVFNSYTTNGGPCNVIGKRWGGTSFNGKISQVSINTKSLSDPEILRNFNATKSRFGL